MSSEKQKQELYPSFNDGKAYLDFYKTFQEKIWRLFRLTDLSGLMDIQQWKPVILSDIYVPLRFGEKDLSFAQSEEEIDRYEDTYQLDQLLKKNRQVILTGYPGSGKTTLTGLLTSALSAPEPTDIAIQLGKRIPLPFILREHVYALDSLESLLQSFIDKYERTLKMKIPREMLDYYLKKGWCCIIFDGFDEIGSTEKRQRLRDLIVLDFTNFNLKNFVVVTGRPTGFQDCSFKNAAVNYDSSFSKKENFPHTILPIFQQFFIQPFNRFEVELFSQKWFQVREKDPDKKKIKSQQFIQAVSDHKGFIGLKRKPIFLTMMAYIHESRGELPYTRAEAYEEMVKTYIHIMDQTRQLEQLTTGVRYPTWHLDDKRRILEEIGFHFHKNASENQNTNLQIIYSKKEFRDILIKIIDQLQNDLISLKYEVTECSISKYLFEKDLLKSKELLSKEKALLKKISYEDKNEEKVYIPINEIIHLNKRPIFNKIRKILAYNLLDFLLARTGLLWERNENEIQFSHLSFQEFLAAQRIYRYAISEPFEMEAYLREQLFEPLKKTEWLEVGLLFFAIYKRYSQNGNQKLLERLLEFNFQHYRFLIQLISSLDKNLSQEFNEKWVFEIIYFILTKEDIKLGKELVSIVDLNVLESVWFQIFKYINQKKSILDSIANLVRKNIIVEKNHANTSFEEQIANFLILTAQSKYLSEKCIDIIEKIFLKNPVFFKNEKIIYALSLFSFLSQKIAEKCIEKKSLSDILNFESYSSLDLLSQIYNSKHNENPICCIWVLDRQIEILFQGLILFKKINLYPLNRRRKVIFDKYYDIDINNTIIDFYCSEFVNFASKIREFSLALELDTAHKISFQIALNLTKNLTDLQFLKVEKDEKDILLEFINKQHKSINSDNWSDVSLLILSRIEKIDIEYIHQQNMSIILKDNISIFLSISRYLLKILKMIENIDLNFSNAIKGAQFAFEKLIFKLKEENDYLPSSELILFLPNFCIYWLDLIILIKKSVQTPLLTSKDQLMEIKKTILSSEYLNKINEWAFNENSLSKLVNPLEFDDYIKQPWSLLGMIDEILALPKLLKVTPEKVNAKFIQFLDNPNRLKNDNFT